MGTIESDSRAREEREQCCFELVRFTSVELVCGILTQEDSGSIHAAT
jgi:hypothetical protein